MTDPGRTAQLLFNVDRRVGFGSGFMPPSMLAWAEPRGIPTAANLKTVAVGQTGVFAAGQLDGAAGLFYSSNGGATWRNITARLPTDTTGDYITALAANPGDPHVYIGTHGGLVFKSSNDGASFTDISVGAGFTGYHIYSMAFNHPDHLWAGAGGGLLKHYDHSTWTNRSSTLGWGANAIVGCIAQKPINGLDLLVGGEIITGPTGKLAYVTGGWSVTDRSSLIPSCIGCHCLGYSKIDNRFLISGHDGSYYTRVYYSTDNCATGNQIAALADSGGGQYAAFHVILDTWAAVRKDGAVFRLAQDRAGDVRLADDVTDIIGAQSAFASAQALAYDPGLNRYYLCGTGWLRYSDDVGQVGAFITRPLPTGSNLIGQVGIAPCSYANIELAAGTQIKTGPGKLVGFLITSVANTAHDVDFFDGVSTSDPRIVKVRVNSNTYGPNPISFTPAHPIQFTNGLYIYVGHGNDRILVAYL
ncbi:MAG: hypothetical protein GX605_09125 [Chloroflexi bacterium]|nr:hypothetical protein [Chloroflexota bacterium]